MPTDPRKRQKKQERKAAKRKSKHQELARAQHTGLAERMAASVKYPVLESWVTDDLWTQGMGYVCLSRALPNGSVAFALFLVDRYCLGVKNAMADVAGRFTYDSNMRQTRSRFTAREVSPACARKIVEQAVEYARALGLYPHPDYQKGKMIFGGIDAGECKEEFEFGKDGKPFFISGPNDTPERCRQIVRTLEQARGPGGYDYLIAVGGPSGIPPELRGRGGVRLIGPDETGTIRDLDMDVFDDPDDSDSPS
jgi:hypothetical protein